MEILANVFDSDAVTLSRGYDNKLYVNVDVNEHTAVKTLVAAANLPAVAKKEARKVSVQPVQLSALAYNLGNLGRRLVKTGGRLVKHARYYWLFLAGSHLTRRLFASMLQRIWALPVPTG